MAQNLHKTRGTSLIEVLIYISLYSIIMASTIVSVWTIITSSARIQMSAFVSQEGNFIVGKIECCMGSGVSAEAIANLVSSRIAVHDVTLGTNPVSASFTLSATSTDGHVVSQEFYATK